MVGLPRQILFAGFFALLSAANISAQSVPPAQSMLLPDRFASWETGKQPPYVMWPRSEAAARLDSHPEYTKLLVESGVVRVEEHGYQMGGSELEVQVFQLRDPSSAYEVYTSLLKPGLLPARVGQVGAFSKDHVLIQVGNLVLESTANASRDDLNALVQALAAKGGTAPLPPIPNYLPNDGLVPGSERYALGPVAFRSAAADLNRAEFAALSDEVGFRLGAETMLARYRTRDDQEAVL